MREMKQESLGSFIISDSFGRIVLLWKSSWPQSQLISSTWSVSHADTPYPNSLALRSQCICISAVKLPSRQIQVLEHWRDPDTVNRYNSNTNANRSGSPSWSTTIIPFRKILIVAVHPPGAGKSFQIGPRFWSGRLRGIARTGRSSAGKSFPGTLD
jgi:hypothetical protein